MAKATAHISNLTTAARFCHFCGIDLAELSLHGQQNHENYCALKHLPDVREKQGVSD
jgi:hypothetical protein